ncbi:LPXTG cell wall anchor domain-containing protein, partial [Ruminococcus sp.]|uniref:LPXTG cell wall anchor domain-containing protein n=1 Tax=Ruminococcus sp. TaxID=41978 RepID=UPI0025E2D114
KAIAMLSNKNTYVDIRVAVEEAVKAGESTELTLFGNVDVTADVTIPDYVDVLIAPDTIITVKSGCKLIAKGDVKDFSGYNYNLSGNGPILPVTTTTTTTSTASTTSGATTSAASTTSGATTSAASTTSGATTSAASTTSGVTSSAVSTTMPVATTLTESNIATNNQLAIWAMVDYQDKTVNRVADADINTANDGQLEITLKDKNGKVLDIYTIDPKTGEGTNSANEAISLPQTGNNSITNIMLALIALFMIGIGISAVLLSGVYNRRKKENK